MQILKSVEITKQLFRLLIFFRYPVFYCDGVAFVMQIKNKRIVRSVYINRLKLSNNLSSVKLFLTADV